MQIHTLISHAKQMRFQLGLEAKILGKGMNGRGMGIFRNSFLCHSFPCLSAKNFVPICEIRV